MNKNRLTQHATPAALFLLMLAVPGPARGDIPQSHPMTAPNLAMPGQQKIGSIEDAFAGLDLTDEQKAEVQKIRQDTEAHKTAIAKARNIDQDQKDAMIQGYIRLEYSRIFRALTPAQRRLVQERIRAQQAVEAPNKNPNNPRKSN